MNKINIAKKCFFYLIILMTLFTRSVYNSVYQAPYINDMVFSLFESISSKNISCDRIQNL